MESKNQIERNKKYLFKFPEGTTSEKQAEYLQKVSEKLKTEQFVAIDPKIGIFPATESNEVKENVKQDETKTSAVDDSKSAESDSKPEETADKSEGTTDNVEEKTTAAVEEQPKTEEPKTETSQEKVTIEKVEQEPKPEEAKDEDHPLMNE